MRRNICTCDLRPPLSVCRSLTRRPSYRWDEEDVAEREVMGWLCIAHWRRKNAHGLALALHITITLVHDRLHIGWVR